MNEHVTVLIGPYHDGELSPALQAEVENHLADCAECRAELESLQTLSALLSTEPGLDLAEPPTAYGRRLAAALPDQQARAGRIPAAAWRFTPAALFGLWAFIQSAILVAGGLSLFGGLLPAADRLLSAPAPLEQGGAASFLGALLPGTAVFSAFDWLAAQVPGLDAVLPLLLVSLAVTGLIAVLYLGWLASLFVIARQPVRA